MAVRRDQQADAAPLSSGVVMLLLEGWGAKWDRNDEEGAFELYQGNMPEAARLWGLHERFLRAEAVRLGVSPKYDGLFFAEAAAMRTL